MASRALVSGLRTRYFPKSRIGQGLISLAPWFDLLVVLGLLILLEGKFTITPGVVVDLPAATMREGLRSELSAVLFTVERTRDGGREEVLVFDDELYHVEQADEMTRFYAAVTKRSSALGETALILFVDNAVSHGTVAEISDRVRGAGITRLNVATRRDTPDQGW